MARLYRQLRYYLAAVLIEWAYHCVKQDCTNYTLVAFNKLFQLMASED